MSEAKERLLREALALDVRDRAEVAAELLASLDDGPADPEVDAAWAAETEQRVRRTLSGASAGSPWSDVRARIEARRGR